MPLSEEDLANFTVCPWVATGEDADEPCVCGTGFTCFAHAGPPKTMIEIAEPCTDELRLIGWEPW